MRLKRDRLLWKGENYSAESYYTPHEVGGLEIVAKSKLRNALCLQRGLDDSVCDVRLTRGEIRCLLMELDEFEKIKERIKDLCQSSLP